LYSMTPAGGIGANTAVRDSALLGRLLGDAGGSKPGITAAYEKEMRIYGSEAVAYSFGMAQKQFKINGDDVSLTSLLLFLNAGVGARVRLSLSVDHVRRC
jgi:2-polyprenyl-6-methoxyphenol hydroxylase-like FAD-dependent oxidoreductase